MSPAASPAGPRATVRPWMASVFALAALVAPLGAQSAWTLGVAATVGSGWQIEGADFGLVRVVGAGAVRHASLVARLGSFVNQGAIIGGSRGFVAALMLGLRTGAVQLFEVGDERAPAPVALDVSAEAGGYLGTHSPLPQGSSWLAAALLPAIRVGNPAGTHFRLLLGPAVFFGATTDVRAFLGLRVETPLARREREP